MHHLTVIIKNDLVSTEVNPLSTYLGIVISWHRGSSFTVIILGAQFNFMLLEYCWVPADRNWKLPGKPLLTATIPIFFVANTSDFQSKLERDNKLLITCHVESVAPVSLRRASLNTNLTLLKVTHITNIRGFYWCPEHIQQSTVKAFSRLITVEKLSTMVNHLWNHTYAIAPSSSSLFQQSA